ncbi:uncharacterized protein LOC134669502 isoform X2 [Cydia fagiglandana]|uniref:uncharacterized protein LOC134669502 isoform X2 n=1 Tax=Cydia fagiglandana TaxID=1458189 RepID=UPI002FEE35CE
MQYYSPYNGCPNNEANFSYTPTPPVFPRLQIVGEGDVTSLTLPDGTLQLYFIPVSRSTCFNQWGPVPALSAWFIRTIPNLFAAPQPFVPNYRDTTQVSNIFLKNNAVNEEISKPQFQFHSDQATSSTDLHCFSQPPHNFWYPRQTVETQADSGGSCRSCTCMPSNPETRCSDMSIDGKDEDKSTCSCHKKVNKVRFSSDSIKYDKHCDNCKCKCNVTRYTSDKSN